MGSPVIEAQALRGKPGWQPYLFSISKCNVSYSKLSKEIGQNTGPQ